MDSSGMAVLAQTCLDSFFGHGCFQSVKNKEYVATAQMATIKLLHLTQLTSSRSHRFPQPCLRHMCGALVATVRHLGTRWRRIHLSLRKVVTNIISTHVPILALQHAEFKTLAQLSCRVCRVPPHLWLQDPQECQGELAPAWSRVPSARLSTSSPARPDRLNAANALRLGSDSLDGGILTLSPGSFHMGTVQARGAYPNDYAKSHGTISVL